MRAATGRPLIMSGRSPAFHRELTKKWILEQPRVPVRAMAGKPRSRKRLALQTFAVIQYLKSSSAARLDFNGLTTRPKKQSTRLLKCECPTCGYIARVAWKWLEDKGAPHCPEHGEMEVK